MTLRFALNVDIEDVHVAGPPVEYAPFVASYSTWGSSAVPTAMTGCTRRLTIAALPLDTSSPAAHPDDAIWLTLFTLSRKSGDPELEKMDPTPRRIEAGVARLSVRDLLAQGPTVDVTLPLHDDRLRAVRGASATRSKGKIHVTGTLETDDDWGESVQVYRAWLALTPTPNYKDEKAMVKLVNIYRRHFFNDGCKYPPSNEMMGRLHLPIYFTDMGAMPPIAYWLMGPGSRLYRNHAEREAVEASLATDPSLLQQYVQGRLELVAARKDLSAEEFIRIVASQEDSVKLQPAYMRCVDALNQLASSIVSGAHYTRDFRILADSDERVLIDSFDTALDGIRNGIDCEDLEQGVSVFYTLLKRLAIRWADTSELWRAIASVFSRYMAFDAAALATAAFTGGSHMGRRMGNLPRFGSREDRESEDIGHCHGWLFPRCRVREWLLDGNVVESDAPAFFALEIAPFEHALPVCIFEGTGPTDSFVMPLERAYGGIDNETFKNEALRQLISERLLRDIDVLADHYSPGPSPYYMFDRNLSDRRLSPFYRAAAHAVSVELFEYNPALCQVAFILADRETFGIRIEVLLESHLQPVGEQKIKMIAPYVEHRELWEKELIPHMAAVQHQMSRTTFEHFTHRQASLVTLRCGEPRETKSRSPPSSEKGWMTIPFRVNEGQIGAPSARAVNAALKHHPEVVGWRWCQSRAMPQFDMIVELHVYVNVAEASEHSHAERDVLRGLVPSAFQSRLQARK